MIGGLVKKVIGTRNEREIKRLVPIVDRVGALEAGVRRLGDAELKGKTALFRERVASGESLDDLLPEAFAVVQRAVTGLVEDRIPLGQLQITNSLKADDSYANDAQPQLTVVRKMRARKAWR